MLSVECSYHYASGALIIYLIYIAVECLNWCTNTHIRLLFTWKHLNFLQKCLNSAHCYLSLKWHFSLFQFGIFATYKYTFPSKLSNEAQYTSKTQTWQEYMAILTVTSTVIFLEKQIGYSLSRLTFPVTVSWMTSMSVISLDYATTNIHKYGQISTPHKAPLSLILTHCWLLIVNAMHQLNSSVVT